MIVVDIETSGGLDPYRNGIWQIGALELEKPKNIFLQESRIDDEDKIEEEALKVIGKTAQELRDTTKQTQKQLLSNFFNWARKIKQNDLIAHNTPFDFSYLSLRAKKYDLDFPFKHRSIDLHTLAVARYHQIHRKYPLKEGKSSMNLGNVLDFCGIEDKRIAIKEGKVIQEGSPHNGLEDAKLEAECYSRLLYKKPLLEDFAKFPIPKYLKK